MHDLDQELTSYVHANLAAYLQHLKQQGGEGAELPHGLAQAQQGPYAAQAQGEVAGGGHKAHRPQQHLGEGVHQGPQLLQATHHSSGIKWLL